MHEDVFKLLMYSYIVVWTRHAVISHLDHDVSFPHILQKYMTVMCNNLTARLACIVLVIDIYLGLVMLLCICFLTFMSVTLHSDFSLIF